MVTSSTKSTLRIYVFCLASEQNTIISQYTLKKLVFITDTGCVYCAVRNKSLNLIQVSPSL